MLRRLTKKTKNLFRTAKLSVTFSRMVNKPFASVFRNARIVCKEGLFQPDEAFRLGLFNPELTTDERTQYLSRKRLTKIQKKLNPESWAPILKNKGIFYRHCIALDIPVPKIYGIFLKEMSGWCFDNSILNNRDDWRLFFENKVCDKFVIKPTHGAFGSGVSVFSRKQGGFIDSVGKMHTPSEMYSVMNLDSKHDGFLIQKRLRNHSEIIRLTNTEYLQTARITTLIDARNCCHIIHAHLKLITGSNVTDGFDKGQSGNIQAMIGLDDGILKPAVTMAQDGSGLRTLDIHPKTGIKISGFALPFWNDACTLVRDAAIKFTPLQTIGWDVAFTPDGPVIVEGNIWWDPPNQHRRMNEITEALLHGME